VLTGTALIIVACYVFRYGPTGIRATIALLSQIDKSLEEASQGLGAGSGTTFRRITLPLIMPAVLAGGLLSFALSIDDFVTTSFNAGQTTTFPLWVYGASRIGVPPQVNVMGTLIFVVGVALAAATAFGNRAPRTIRTEEAA
jgi:spermidine/putrescine transport system permease protein